jgi:hypothetical protein
MAWKKISISIERVFYIFVKITYMLILVLLSVHAKQGKFIRKLHLLNLASMLVTLIWIILSIIHLIGCNNYPRYRYLLQNCGWHVFYCSPLQYIDRKSNYFLIKDQTSWHYILISSLLFYNNYQCCM